MRIRKLLPVACVALCTCDASTTSPPPIPSRLVWVSGHNQSAAVASQLAESVVLRVEDASGHPLARHVVIFRALNGGTLQPTRDTTASDGLVRARWTLGDTAGLQHASAILEDATGATLLSTELLATGLAGRPHTLSAVAGDQQSGPVGSALSEPLSVRVRDSRGNPAPGATVRWSVVTGVGSLSSNTSITDSTGVAYAIWRLGAGVGPQSVTASVAFVSVVTFAANAVAGAAAAVTITPGTIQINAAETLQLSAAVRDAFGNPAGEPLSWTSTVPAVATVSTSGLVSGEAVGTAQIVAAAGSAADTAQVTVTAALPASLAVNYGDGRTVLVNGWVVPSVIVRDARARPLSGVTVSFTVTSGGGYVSTPTYVTQSDGIARVNWRIGPSAGVNTLTATVEALPPVTIMATAVLTLPPLPLTIDWWGENTSVASDGRISVGVRFNRSTRREGGAPTANADVSTGVRSHSTPLWAAAFSSPGGTAWPPDPLCGYALDPLCFKGLVSLKCVPPGSYTLTASGTASDGVRAGISRTITTVEVAFSRIILRVPLSWVIAGGTLQATAIPDVIDACPTFAWSSSNPAVATVNSSGLITGVAPGFATITVSASGITAETIIEVR